MTETGVRSGRLLSILLLLQSRGALTARQIATSLGVSVRTVYRDTEVLGAIGVPIYAEPGRLGGYRLVDGYRTTLTGLTAHEALALFLIGLPAPAASLGLSESARAAENKLLAALSPAHRERAGRLRERFLLDLPAWYQDGAPPAHLPELAEAVLADRRVRVRYRRWEEPREVRRVLNPHGLVVKNGTWYLVASTGRAGARTYRVGNILDLHPTDESFERSPGFDLGEYWRTQLAEFDRRRITGVVRLRIAPRLVARLDDVGTAQLRAAAAAGHLDESGWTCAELPIESPEWAANQLIGYGGEVEIVDPPDARDAIRALAAAVLDRHTAPPQLRRRPRSPSKST